ncbi:MAG: HAMP domain-containing histidine kinase [Bacteroidales bacterium]|nr:HAMP domain-containing histidine kinase [Bacteroidales bacterium]
MIKGKKGQKNRIRNKRWRVGVIAISILMSLVVLLYTNTVISKIRDSEQEKITLWVNAVGHKAQLVQATEAFFRGVDLDERRKMELYTQVLNSFNQIAPGSDADFSLAYISYIVDSSKTSFVIMNADSVITNCSNYTGDPELDRALIGTKMTPEDIASFSRNEAVHYSIWGMEMILLYKESEIYEELQAFLDNLNRSFFSDITNNSVFVPVIMVDSTRQSVIDFGNIDPMQFSTAEKLAKKLHAMERENDPLELILPNNQRAYVYYESTPLLKQMRYLPYLYVLISVIVLLVSVVLLRTARSEEENHMWVGMAKETAHQLGTPISSLLAWVEYLQDKPLSEPYISEIHKDLDRLDMIARRFSKIGSIPELKEENVCEVVNNTLLYLRPRMSKKVSFVNNIPNEPHYAMINAILLGWVIENLCKNAMDAMEGAGTFSVTVSHVGKYIYIDCSNTGRPIPSKQQKYIFESGYSTKTRGWGLGLSLAKRIINEYHKGEISLKSSTQESTTFRIKLRSSR